MSYEVPAERLRLLKAGQPMTHEEFAALSPDEQESWTQKEKVVHEEIDKTIRQYKAVDKEVGTALEEMDRQVASYALKHLFEGIEILTGVKAGALRGDGCFKEGTVNGRVATRLRELSETLSQFGSSEWTGDSSRLSPLALP